jgi:hypothetical protein
MLLETNSSDILRPSYKHPLHPAPKAIVFAGFPTQLQSNQAIPKYNTKMSKNIRSNVRLNFLGPA